MPRTCTDGRNPPRISSAKLLNRISSFRLRTTTKDKAFYSSSFVGEGHRPEIILIGDRISKSSQITVGGEAISRIKQIKADLCILGTNAVDIEHGMTDNDWEVVQVKKAMIESSKKVVSLTISEKLNSAQRLQVCSLDKIDVLITELLPNDELLKPYMDTGINVL